MNNQATQARQVSGFTLIELMIVIVIMSLAAGLIGPLTVKALEKAQAKTEFLRLTNTLKTLTTLAFTRGYGYKVTLEHSSMVISSVKGQEVTDFEYLTFPGRSFFINSNGFPSIDAITISLAGQDKLLTIEDILGVKTQQIYSKDE